MDVQKIHKSMFVDFPNIVRLPKLHFATNTSFVLENKPPLTWTSQVDLKTCARPLT